MKSSPAPFLLCSFHLRRSSTFISDETLSSSTKAIWFSQVAELKLVWWLEIKGSIETKNLSPRTTYAAYLVHKLPEESKRGFEGTPITLHIVYKQRVVAADHSMILDPLEDMPRNARRRGRGGWTEIEMGEFFNGGGDNATVECSPRETSSDIPKSGLIVEGIELRPKGV